MYMDNIPQQLIKKRTIKNYIHEQKEMLRTIFMTYPSYFVRKMENI